MRCLWWQNIPAETTQRNAFCSKCYNNSCMLFSYFQPSVYLSINLSIRHRKWTQQEIVYCLQSKCRLEAVSVVSKAAFKEALRACGTVYTFDCSCIKTYCLYLVRTILCTGIQVEHLHTSFLQRALGECQSQLRVQASEFNEADNIVHADTIIHGRKTFGVCIPTVFYIIFLPMLTFLCCCDVFLQLLCLVYFAVPTDGSSPPVCE